MDVGKKEAEAFYQSYTVRELYFPSGSRCFGECYAEYGLWKRFGGAHVDIVQINTRRDTQVHDIMVATSLLMRQRDYVSPARYKHLA